MAWAAPAAAADWDIIAWLQEMSGPGPFHHGAKGVSVFTLELQCIDDDTSPFKRCLPDRTNVKSYILLETSWFNDHPNPENPNKFDGNVYLRTYQIITYLQGQKVAGLNKVSWLARGMDLGIGGGAYHFTGAAVDNGSLWRFSMPVRIRFTPAQSMFSANRLQNRQKLRMALRAITYHVGWDVLPEGFSNTSFKGPANYAPSGHALWTTALVIDPLVLFEGLIRY
jgi:hypothetical protein